MYRYFFLAFGMADGDSMEYMTMRDETKVHCNKKKG